MFKIFISCFLIWSFLCHSNRQRNEDITNWADRPLHGYFMSFYYKSLNIHECFYLERTRRVRSLINPHIVPVSQSRHVFWGLFLAFFASIKAEVRSYNKLEIVMVFTREKSTHFFSSYFRYSFCHFEQWIVLMFVFIEHVNRRSIGKKFMVFH